MGTVVSITFAVCILLSVPISTTLGLSGLAGLLYTSRDPTLLVILPQKFLNGVDSFPLLAIPLFILSGTIMAHGGIARRIVQMTMVFFGRVKGGLGLVVVLATMFFSGVSGSSSADTAAIGSLTLPGMRDRKYPREYATALLAAAGATGTLVPPSIDLIIIGVVANISIAGLFAAGYLPGAVNAVGIMVLVYYYAHKLNLPLEPRMTLREKLEALQGGFFAFVMVVIIIGGILGGIFTPTEAAAVAVVYGFCVSFFIYKELTLADLPMVLLQTVELTGIVLFLIGMTSAFSAVLTFERIPYLIGQYILHHSGSWIKFVLLVNVLFLFLGCVMDAMPALIVLMPILTPVAVSLGMDPIHFGILVEANVGISLISPPVGVCLYVACGLSRLSIEDIVPQLIPFLLVLVGTLLVISYVPAITLFVPRLLGF